MSTDFTYTFNAGHAKKYGVNEAIMLYCLIFWLAKNEANGKHYHDGRTWTYNSVTAFEKLFPFWTRKQIRGVLDSLERQGVIMKGNYNEQKYDRTSWYAFTDEFQKSMLQEGQIHVSQTGKSICPKGQMDLPEKANRNAEKGEPIPVILPVILPDNSSTNVLHTDCATAAENRSEFDPESAPNGESSAPREFLPLFDEESELESAQHVEQPSAKNPEPAASERKEKSSAKKEKKPGSDLTPTEFTAWLEARGVSHDLAAEWAEFRRKSRNVNSLRALAPIDKALKELASDGISPDQAIEVALTIDPANGKKKSWETLVADWVRNYLNRINGAGQPSPDYNRQAPAAKPSKFDINAQAMADAMDMLNQRV